MTSPVDISPEAVEEMAEWCENGGRRRTVRPSEMLRALRASLTATQEDLSSTAELAGSCANEVLELRASLTAGAAHLKEAAILLEQSHMHCVDGGEGELADSIEIFLNQPEILPLWDTTP